MCAARLLAGEALRSLCLDLNERGIATVTGGPWKTQTLRRMLMSARISGQREHRGEIVANAEWPAIITPSRDAAAPRASLRSRAGARTAAPAATCSCACSAAAAAGRRWSRDRADGGDRRYVCANGPNFGGCGHMYAMAEPLEHFVVEAVLYRLDSPELAAALARQLRATPTPTAGRQRSSSRSSSSTSWRAMYGRREIGLSEWQAARSPIERRVTQAKKRLARLSPNHGACRTCRQRPALREQWPNLPLTRQHAIVAALLDHVLVSPGRPGINRFQSSRFEPVWRA